MTLDDGQQHHVWIYENAQYFQFAVRACSSASVFLSATPLAEDINTTVSYEVILGAVSNSLVVLRRNPGGQVIQTAERPYLLSCYAERYPFMPYGLFLHIANTVGKWELKECKMYPGLAQNIVP